MKANILILIVLPFLMAGCFYGDACMYTVPQKWHLSTYEADMITTKPVLKIGDTLLFKFSIDRYLVDIDSQELDIDLGIQVFNKITTTSNPGDTVQQDFFYIDTTIAKVFDQYFDVNVIKGNMTNVYFIECQLYDNRWEIEIQYICKKAGSYYAHAGIRHIYTSQTDDNACMLGDANTFGAQLILKQNEFNRIDYLFQVDKEEYPGYYGFIVE